MKKIAIFFFITNLFFACASESSNYSSMKEADYSAQATTMQEESATSSNASIPERKLIQSVDMQFEVKDLEASTSKIKKAIKQYGGFISDMHQDSRGYSMNNSLAVRLPSQHLDAFTELIESESIFTDHKKINADDVTEEFVDISARMKTKKEVRDRYIAILRDRAENVSEVLDAEEKIRRIQEEIESIEGRLKYINDRVAYSTVQLNFYQKTEYIAQKSTIYEKSFFTKAMEGFSNGFEMIQLLILAFINIWPIAIIAIVTISLRKTIWSGIRK